MIDLPTLSYKPGWEFRVDPDGSHFWIGCPTVDSATWVPKQVIHGFGVPASEPAEGWVRWLYDRIVDVERHETREFFIVDGGRPFYPKHGREGDPYEHQLAAPRRTQEV